jgi:hypothetical protein
VYWSPLLMSLPTPRADLNTPRRVATYPAG